MNLPYAIAAFVITILGIVLVVAFYTRNNPESKDRGKRIS